MPETLQGAQIKRWRENPHLMVRELFKVTPDQWQDEILQLFPTSPRIAMKASKGVGKTGLEAWLAWNFLLTRPHPNIAATSINGDNLRDGLWKEMAHWRARSPLLVDMFEWQTQRIYHRSAPATWFMSARTWPKTADADQLGQTLAGLHSDYIMFVVDESGAIPVPIMLSAEAALSSCVEGHIIQAGNTNSLDGALYEACVRQKHMWTVREINGDPDNPNRSPRISLEWATELIKTYGRDDPHVKVMILGQWPKSSINALLGPDDVEEAMQRKYQQHDIDHAARILGVDVAREGDDASVIFPRQGLVAFPPKIMFGVNGNQGAGQVARTWTDWDVDAVFIDNTGGYGASWIDQLANLNRNAIPVGFAQSALDKRYHLRRSEMWFKMAEWIKNGGALPNVPELVAELSQTTYSFKGDAIFLEPKEFLKKKLGRSPDRADALALTFAEPVIRKMSSLMPIASRREERYDPYSEMLRG